jgi:predicted Co/Zn/Cd cation transporter (cation efflux family)
MLIFVAGAACGAGFTVVVVANRVQHAIQHPEEAPPRIAARLKWRLGLDDDQQAKVEAIVAKHQVELLAIRREFQPKVVDQLEQVRDEISGVLNDSQRERWTKLFDEVRERWLPAMPK